MSEPMTSEALHDIYAPLWEAVPETRPEGLEYDDDATNESGEDLGPPAFFLEGDEVSERIAAALCRVAAEDWLLSRYQCGYLYLIRTPEGTYSASMYQWLEQNDPVTGPIGTGAGPNIHAGLVAACLAVPEDAR